MISNKKIALCALLWMSTHYAMEKKSITLITEPTLITTWKEAKPFAGCVVAYTKGGGTSHEYISTSQGSTKYMYIHKKHQHFDLSIGNDNGFGYEHGYGTKKLLNHKDTTVCSQSNPLINKYLKSINFKVRHITQDEKKIILSALREKRAKFDIDWQKTENEETGNIVLALLD